MEEEIKIEETDVPGLYLIRNFITKEEESKYLKEIETAEWKLNRAGTRRIQMYGPWHDENYTHSEITKITPLPQYSKEIAERITKICVPKFPQFNLASYNLGNDNHTELFINEYLNEHELQFHHDHRSEYKEVIFGVSFISTVILCFKHNNEELKVNLPPQSLYLMTGDSRFKYKHGMHKYSLTDGDKRVSLTYRTIDHK